jgi:hypothetical protein
LKNHLGVVPTKFAQTRSEDASYMRRNNSFHFGDGEGLVVRRGDPWLCNGYTYQASSQGVALFSGEGG